MMKVTRKTGMKALVFVSVCVLLVCGMIKAIDKYRSENACRQAEFEWFDATSGLPTDYGSAYSYLVNDDLPGRLPLTTEQASSLRVKLVEGEMQNKPFSQTGFNDCLKVLIFKSNPKFQDYHDKYPEVFGDMDLSVN